ncbi:hypothetical protein CP97_00255 [Aurantiacibacter atlanticus]|uniref:MmeI-like N-terminal domain-containing protein n=1 Tax=Aurantiacibacter atlanticus TaxID=1648404 RepID=A0A0H4V8J1_9SPHN|nr:hypothetical protein CP97_00255 [Aurantiacibacter atlanticus]
MRLGWDEIKRRAKTFSEEWKDSGFEKGETQTFYNEFFEIFGIKRKQVAIYEQRVKLLSQKHGFIDLFWPGTLLVEQKSSNLDLDRAQGQGRRPPLPRRTLRNRPRPRRTPVWPLRGPCERARAAGRCQEQAGQSEGQGEG